MIVHDGDYSDGDANRDSVSNDVGDGRDDVGDFNGCHNGDSVEHAVERDGGYNCGYANCDDCILFMMKSAGSYHVMVSYDGNL
jgi:hypothetical protein